MSLDIGILIQKNRKNNIITVSEVNLSSGQERLIKKTKTAEEALAQIEEHNPGYEEIIARGFLENKGSANLKK